MTFNASGPANGSGRTVIWSEYQDAFDDGTDERPSTLLVSVGINGIKELYDNTDLAERGLRTTRLPFLPIHSDLIALLLAGGLVALVFVVALLAWGARFFGAANTPNVAVASAGVLVIFFSVDMIQYAAGPAIVLLAGVFASQGVGPGRLQGHSPGGHEHRAMEKSPTVTRPAWRGVVQPSADLA